MAAEDEIYNQPCADAKVVLLGAAGEPHSTQRTRARAWSALLGQTHTQASGSRPSRASTCATSSQTRCRPQSARASLPSGCLSRAKQAATKPPFNWRVRLFVRLTNSVVDSHLIKLQIWDTAGQERFVLEDSSSKQAKHTTTTAAPKQQIPRPCAAVLPRCGGRNPRV